MISPDDAKKLLAEAMALQPEAEALRSQGPSADTIESIWTRAYELMIKAQKITGHLINLRPVPFGRDPEGVCLSS